MIMKEKYKSFIDYVINTYQGVYIKDPIDFEEEEEAEYTISITADCMGGVALFKLTEIENSIIIRWELISGVYGIHRRQWDFLQGNDIEKIIETFKKELKRILEDIFN